MATEAETKETISESQHIVQGPFYDLHPDAVGMFDSSKGTILYATPIDSQLSFKESVSQHVNIFSEELTSKGNNNEAKDEKVSEVKEQLVSETVDGNVTMDEETTSDESTCNKVDAQAEDKQDEAQGGTESEKLERVNEEPSIKLENETKSVNDESTTGTDSIPGAEPSNNENSREPVGMMTKDELTFVNEKQEVEKLDRVDEESHAKIKAGTGILNDERTNDIDSMLVEEPSEKGNTQEPLEITAKEDSEPTKDEPVHGALESSLSAVHDEPEAFERVSEENNAKIEDEAGLFDDERDNHADSILVSEKENKQEPIDVAATSGLQHSEDVPEHDKLESLLDAVHEDLKGLKGKCEIETMSKEELIVNVEERSLEDEKRCEPIEKAASELPTVSEATVSETSSETLAANKTNEKNTDDEVEETTEGCEMHEAATSEEMSRDANIDQTVQETEPENLEKVPETMLKDQSSKKLDDVENTNFDISEDGVSLKIEIDTLCTSKAAIEEHIGKTRNMEETSEQDQPDEKNETVRDNDTQNDKVVKHEESHNSVCEDQEETIISRDDTEISEFNEKTSWEHELVSELAPEQRIQEAVTGTEDTRTEKSNFDKSSSSKEISEMVEPIDDKENAKSEASLNKDLDECPTNHVSVEETTRGEVGQNNGEGPSTTSEVQIHQATYTIGITDVDISEEKRETEQFKVISESLCEEKYPKQTGESDATKIDKSIDDDSPNMMVSVVANPNEDAETVKESTEASLHAVKGDHSESRTVIVPVLPDQIGEQEDAPKTECEEQIYEATNGKSNIEADTHEEKADSEELEVITASVLNDHNQENVKPKETDNPDHMDNLDEVNREIADYNDDPGTTTVKDEDVREKAISDVSGTHAFVAEEADQEVGKKLEDDHQITKAEDDKEAAVQEEKENLDINWELGPEIQKGDICETENAKIDKALSLDKDTNGSDVRVDIASDETSRLAVEETVVENNHAVKSDDKLESSNVFETREEEVLKKEESVESIIASRSLNTNSAEVIRENQIEGKEGAPVTVNSEIVGGEEKQKLEDAITEVASRDQSKDICSADGNRKNGTTIEEISEMVEPNEDRENINEAKENKDLDEHTVSVQETLKGEEGQKTGEAPCSVNEDHIHQPTYTKENIDVDISEAERETEKFKVIPESLPEDNWKKEICVFDAIKIDSSTNDNNPTPTISVVANPNEGIETATENETNLNKDKEDHSDSQKLISLVVSDKIGEHENTSTECKRQIYKANDDGSSIEVDIHKEKAHSEELEFIMESVPKDCNQGEVTEPKEPDISDHQKAADISDHSDDLEKETPEISGHSKDTETAKVKDEDVLEKSICDVFNNHELVAEAACDKVDEKHEDAHQIKNTEDNKEAVVQKDDENIDINPDLGPEDQRQGAVCEAERVKVELALNIDKGSAIAENASEATSGLTLEETLEEKNYKLEYDDRTESNLLKNREEKVPTKAEVFDARPGVSSNVVSKESIVVEVEQLSRQITEKEEETNRTVAEAKVAELVPQPDIESTDYCLYTNEASLDKKMQDVPVAVDEKIHNAEEYDSIEVRAILENQIKNEKEIHISLQKEETEDNQQEKENEAGAEQKSYESSDTGKTIENESFKDKETAEDNSEKEKLEDSKPEMSPIVVLEDFETPTGAKDIHESETYKQGMKYISEEIFQKAEDMMITESAIELEPGNQINSSIHTTEVAAFPSKEALKAKALGACPGVSSNSEFNEPIMAEVEHSLPQLADKEQATNGTDKDAKDADLVSQTDIKTMGDTLHANEDSCDMKTQDASVVIEENIQNAQDDGIEVSADSNNETKEEKDAHTSLIKEDLKDMLQEKEIQTEQGSYKSSESCETNEYQSFRYKETAEDISRDIVEDQDPEKLPHVIRDLEIAIETKVIHESEMGKQSTENNIKEDFLKDEDMILVQSVAELEHDNQNNKPIPSADGPIPSAEVSSNTSCEDHTAAEVEHFSQQITEKEEATNGTDEEVDLRNAKDDELISRTDIETVGDSLYANETFHDKSMQDASLVVDEKIRSSSEDKSIQTKGVSENENKEKPDVQTSIQKNEPEEKKHKKDDELITRMGMETTGDSLHVNKASHDKNMQDASVVVDEKIHSSSEDKSVETMGVTENENKEEPDVKTSIQNDEPKDKKQEKDDELISQTDMEIVGDSLYANKASHDQNIQHASVIVEEKIQSSLEDNSTEITRIPENENKEEPDAQARIQDDEPEDKKQEKDDELTSQTDIETAGDSICAKETSLDKNMQDATEVVEEKIQSSSEDMNKETMSISENENKEYLDVQAGIQKDEPEGKKQEKENEIQEEQKCNELQDASDTTENESLKEKAIAENISQNEMTDDQEAEKLPHVVHEDLETTGSKAIDVTETEQEGAAKKNEENVWKCEDTIPAESVIELEHGNQSNNSIYTTEEAPIPSEETSKEKVFVACQGESSGDGLSETTMAEVEHLTREMTEEEEETNDTDEEAKHAELLSQMDIQKMNDTSSANEASFDTNTQDTSVEIVEKVHSTEEDSSTEVRSISEIGSNEEKDAHTSLQKEELEDKPPQKEQEANGKHVESFKDKEGVENNSKNLEVQERMKSPHVVVEEPETATGTEDIHESETEIQSREYNNEDSFQKIEDMILVEPTFKLEPDNQDNKSIYTEEGDIPDEETSKVFNACIEETSNIKPTEPTMDEVEHFSQQMTKKEELIDEEAKEIELASRVDTESMGDALYSTGASLSKNMQDASVAVEEKILGTPEDNSIEVRAVSQNGNKEEQSFHSVLQKEELQDKPIEKENEIQIELESYESCDVNETIEKENFKDKETAENNLEDQKPGNSPHVIDEDLETTRTEGIHESEADKKVTENNSEEYFQKAEDLMIPELATGIETGNQNNNSIYTTEIEIPSEETLKDEVFYACQVISSKTGTSEPAIAEVEHLSQQIIDKHETSNGTDEEISSKHDKEVELASEMNIETRSVPYLQANEASIDKNLQDSSLVVEEKIQSSSEDGSIEVTAFLKNENKEQDVEKSLQEDMPQENEFEIQAEQKSYEVSNVRETIENESLKEKATAENNSERENLEDQESESHNVVHEDPETTIGTEVIHESETEKQVTENNNEENFLKDEDMMFAESVTELDTGNEINKSIHTTEPEIPSEEILKEEVFDACQQSFFNTKLGKPIVAEIENLSQDLATKEAATNGTNEVVSSNTSCEDHTAAEVEHFSQQITEKEEATNGTDEEVDLRNAKDDELISRTDIETVGDSLYANETFHDKSMQDASLIVDKKIRSSSEDKSIQTKGVSENENKEKPDVQTSMQKNEPEEKKHKKDDELITRMGKETTGDSLHVNEASHDKNMQDASVVVDEKIHSSSEDKSVETMGVPENENKEEPDVKTSIQNDEPKDKKQEKDDELISQTDMEIVGDSLYANEASHDQNIQHASVIVEEKIQSSLEDNSTEITRIPENENKEEPDAQASIQDDEPEDKKQEKDDELTSQTDIETAGDSICAKETSLDKNMQDATEVVEEKIQSSSEDMNKETMSISENENKEYLDVQAGIQKDEPEGKKQEKENEIQEEQKCNELQDASDTTENESLKEKAIAENISQNEMTDDQEAEKLPHVVHEDLETTGSKAIDVTETEQEGAAKKNEENVWKCEDTIPAESVIELEHGNQSNNSIYTTEEAPIPSEAGESSGDGLSETTMAEVEHLTREMTEEEEETNDTDEEAKHAELLSQMDIQKMNDTSSANEASFDTNTQDTSVEIVEKVHSTEEDSSTEVRSISEIGSNEEKDVHTSLQKEELEDKPPQKENEIQKEQEANESNEANGKHVESFKDKEGAENNSKNLEVQERMKSPHVVVEEPETATGTEDIHESETEIQSREYNNEDSFQKIEDMILVEPTFKLEPGNQDNKSIYTEEGDIPDEETSKVFNACIEETSNIKPTEPTMDEVEHFSQQMTKKEELIDEEAKEIELASRVDTESMGDALYSTGASLSKNMQDASVAVEEKILGTPEDNSIEVRAVSQNGNKEEQSVHSVLQKEELQDKPIEKETEIQIELESYESCDVNETIEKENFKDKETAENNLEKEILEDQNPGKSPHVIDEDLETTRTEGIHESEADKKVTENNSEEYFQKAEDLMIPELATGIETGNQNNNSIYTTEIEIPSEETLKDEVFYACQGISSKTGTSEPAIAEVEHLSQQIIDKHETSNGTDEEISSKHDKEVELASEMNIETRSVPYLQANEASIDKNLQDSSLVVEEKIQSSSEDGSIEVTAYLKNENKEQDVEKSLQEDMPQENEFEIQAEQKSYEVSNVSETIENESLKEKATTENNSEREKLEDQESESHNVVHEDPETTIGTEVIHESETEKQVTENNNEENFLKDEDMMFAESVTELDTGNEINKSIHTTEPEIPSEEILEEEVFDPCQQSFFNTKLGKPIVAEIENLSQDLATKEAATNGTNEVDKNSVFVSQTDIEPIGDNSCSDEVSLETTMQDTPKVVEENISMSEDNRILVRAILEDENKEEHAVHTSIQKEDIEVKPQEKENKIHTEQKSYTLTDASETYRSSKEKETEENNSENEKLEDQEPEKSLQMVLEDLDTANETEDIHGSETEKQDTESVIELEPDNTNNNSIHCTEGVAPIEEKTSLIDDVAKVDVHNERNRCNILGDVSVTCELIEESKHMERQGPFLQKDSKEVETHQKAEQSASTVTQNEVIADSNEILNIKLQKDVNEVMQLDASSDTLLRNQEITIEKSIVFEEDTIEAIYEHIRKDESEAKKDELATDSVPNNQVKENDCQSLKQTTTLMDLSGNLGTSSVVTYIADETEKEVDEKFSKISDYWPAQYNEEASNVNAVDREHKKEITSVVGQPSGIEKFTFTSDSTDASKLDACKEGREMLNEFSNLVSKGKEIDEKICSSTVLTENKENPHEQSAMQETEVIKPVVMETEQVINNASHEVKFDNLQEEEHDLPVSQFLMKHILEEEGDTLNKTCEEECEDVTNKRDEREKENEAEIPKQEETSKPEDNAGCEKLQNSDESAQTEESGDAMDNSEGTVVKNEVSLQSTLEGSKSKLAVIEDEKDEIATVLPEKSVHTVTDDSMELVSTEKRIPEIKLDGKPCNESDLVQDEKIQASIFEETITEKDTQKGILQKESGEESKEQLQNVGNAEVSEDKIGEILETGSEVVECGEEKQDVGTQILILKNDSEEELKLSKSHEDRQTDLAIESTIHSLKRDGNLMEDKNLAVMVETTDDKGDVNKTDEQKYGKEETDEHKPEKSGNDETTAEATDSELKPIQTDDQTKKSSESSITDDSKLNETLELRSEDKNEESADKKQEVIDQNQGQMKNGMTEELKLSDLQIVQQSDLAMDEDHSMLTTESKVDEDKTDDENDEKEEEDEHKPEEPGHDAAVIVEGRDAEVTPTKKKSHGILSGVGSKVKHSIAKVKKAITGKSSHSKTPPAK